MIYVMVRGIVRRGTALLVTAKPEAVFLVVALLFGIVFVFLTAPFGVADEPNHFYRAYQVSEGIMHPVPLPDGQYGGALPQNLTILTKQLGGDYANPHRLRISFKQLWAAKNLRVDNSKTTLVAFTNTAVYEPANYLPQSIGITLARILPGPPDFLLVFYLGRLVNLLAGVVLIYFAIKWLPCAKWGMVVLFLTPMAVFQLASLSADSLTYGLVALSVGYSLACFYPAHRLARKELIGLGGLILAMGLLRVPYACFGLFPLVVLAHGLRSLSIKKTVAIIGALALAEAFLILYWQHYFGTNVHLTVDPTINPGLQMHNIFDIPWMLGVFIRTHLSGYFNIVTNGIVGVLGWLDTPLPQWTITGYTFFLIVSFIIATPGEKKFTTRQVRCLFLGFCIILFVALDAIEYIYGTSVKFPEIMSIQGRYYIPLLIPLLLATHDTVQLFDKDWRKFHVLRLGFIGLAQIIAVIVVFNHSWLNVT